MRCTNIALLLLSLSFVASVPIKLIDENRTTTEQELPILENSSEEDVVIFPKTDMPVEEVILVVKKPEESGETFTGPPIDVEHKPIISSRKLMSEDSNEYLRAGVKPAPIPPNSPAGKAINKKKIMTEDDEEEEIEDDEEVEEEQQPQTSSRRLLKKRFKKVVKKVGKAIKKIFHKKSNSATKSAFTPAPKATKILDKVKKCKGEECLKKRTCEGKDCKDSKIIGETNSKLRKWLKTEEGKSANKFCKSLNLKKKEIFKGCLEDMIITKNQKIAKESAVAAEEFLTKNKISSSRRFCTASGDPHFTNYDGAYFHLQEPGVYTLAKTHNFEVQEKMRKNGRNVPGVPSCLTGVAIKYKGTIVEADVNNYNNIKVNGVNTPLRRDSDVKIGSLIVRYGHQSVEWKGDRVRATGLKIKTRNGFGVMVLGGYCGVVEVNAPEYYFGKMSGICGNADGLSNKNDFKAPDGTTMNVNFGGRSWDMSGYWGPSAPLSKWQLSWKPTGPDCFLADGCEKDSPAVAEIRAKEAARIKKIEDDERKAEEEARAAEERAKRLIEENKLREAQKQLENAKRLADEAKKAKEESARKEQEAREKEEKRIAEEARKRAEQISDSSSSSSSISISRFKTKKDRTKKIIKILESKKKLSIARLSEIGRRILKILRKSKKNEIGELKYALGTLDSSQKDVNDIYEKYTAKISLIKTLKSRIKLLKKAIDKHFKQMKSDSQYLERLESIKPKFLKTLDIYNHHSSRIRKIISSNIIESDDKSIMLGFLNEADKNTHTTTDKLSKAFLEHYEKYKNLLKKENDEYESEKLELNTKREILTNERKDKKELKMQYKRALKILRKIKKTYSLSKQDSRDFYELYSIIKAIFKNPKRVKQFLSGKIPNKCATTLLKSHAANDLL